MMIVKWAETPGLDEDLLRLWDGERTSNEIAAVLAKEYGQPITGHKVRNRMIELRSRGATQEAMRPEKLPYEIAVEAFNQWIGYRPHEFEIPKSLEAQRKVYLILADLHIPFMDKEAFMGILEAHPSVDGVILAGDVLDCYELSTFVHEKRVPLADEIAEGKFVLKTLAERYPKVWVIEGNHTQRAKKQISNRLPPDWHILVNWNMLDLIKSDLPNVEIVKNQHQNGMESCHWVQIGDAIIGHAETSSKIALRPVENFEDWLLKWRDYLGLPEWRLTCQGHTHSLGMVMTRGGYGARMELGALVNGQGMAYAMAGHCKFGPPVKGYAILTQIEGRTDFNETRFISLTC